MSCRLTGLFHAAGFALAMACTAMVSAQSLTYNQSNGQLTVDTSGLAVVSLKVVGPQAVSIDRWQNGSTQDNAIWTQTFFTNPNNNETSEQWIAIDPNNAFPWPASPVAPGTYQIATYATGLTAGAFGLSEMGDLVSATGPGQTWFGPVTIIPGGAVCDINGSSVCDTQDLRVLYDNIALGTAGGPSDINGSGTVDNNDIGAWLTSASATNGANYLRGDANLAGGVSGADFTTLASNFGNSGLPGAYWDQGNFDGNTGGSFSVGGADFTNLAANFGSGSLLSSVPEPTSLAMLILAVCGVVSTMRKRA